MSENERLGVQIDIVKGDEKYLEALESRLKAIAEKLNKAFTFDGLEKLSAAIQKVNADAAKQGVEKVTKNMTAFDTAAGKAEGTTKALNKALNDMSAFDKWARGLSRIGTETDKVTLATKALTDAQAKSNELVNKATRATGLQQISASALNQQINWNTQAGTQGIRYKEAPGGGFVRYSVDTDTTVNGLSKANSAAIRMDNSLKNLGKTSDFLTTSFRNMTTRLAEFYSIRAVLFAATNQVRTAISEQIKFNQALADTAAISNASTEGVKKFGFAAQMIARNSKMDLQEVMKLMNLLAQSGVAEKDVPLVSRVTSMFATGTGSSAENAVRVMTTALNVWNIEASKSSIVANTLTAGLNSAKLEVNELSTVFNYLAPMAKQAGYSIQETTAIIATMSQMGVKASTIGTGTGQLLTRLMAPTKGVKDLAKAYNLELDQLNPRLHKFSEIVKTLQTADGGRAIPVQDLLKGFGQIAGRSVSAAVTAGADYFKEMERNVSLGNASLVAYSKTIEGAGAKINMLRQTFVQLIGSVTSFNGVIGLGYEFLLSFIRGLIDSEGKVVAAGLAMTGLAAAIYSCRNAIIAFAASNPLTIWAAGIGIVLTGVIAAIGGLSTETAKMSKEHDKLAKDMGATQRAFQVISEMYGKASQAGELNNNITKEHREQLVKLVNTTPSLHGVIDTSVTKYGQLSGALKGVNDQMDRLSKNNLNAYNNAVDKLEKAKDKRGWGGLTRSYNDSERDINIVEAKRIQYIKERQASPDEKEKAIAQIREDANAQREALKDKFKSNADNRKLMDMALVKQASITNGVAINPEEDLENLVFSKYKEGPAYVMPPSNTKTTPTPGIGERRLGGMEKGVDIADSVRKYRNQVAKEVEQLTTKELENKIKMDLEKLKTISNPEDYESQSNSIQASYEVYKKRLVDEFTNDQWVTVANNIGASYKDGHFVFPDTDKGKMDKANYLAYGKDRDVIYGNLVKEAVTAKIKDAESLGNLKGMQIPGYHSKENGITSAGIEKQLSRELMTRQMTISLRKEEAKTAEEVRSLDMEAMHIEEEINSRKIAAYNKDIDTLNLRSLSRDLTADELQQYELIVEKIEAANDQQEALNNKMKTMADNSFWGNFQKGAFSAFKNQGTFQSNTQQLGTDTANTTLSGMNTLLDESISKLAKLEWSWKNFASSLGNTMKAIADELQKYIVKMLVVYAIEKMIGIATSSSYDGGSVPNGVMANQAGASAFNTGSVNWAGGGFANGGLIKGGIPGKDSVPILAMQDEYILNPSATRYYGTDYLNALNEKRIKKFAEGGTVGGSATRSGTASTQGNIVGNVQIVNLVDPASIPQTTDTQIINVINFDLARKGPTYKNIKLAMQN